MSNKKTIILFVTMLLVFTFLTDIFAFHIGQKINSFERNFYYTKQIKRMIGIIQKRLNEENNTDGLKKDLAEFDQNLEATYEYQQDVERMVDKLNHK